MAQQLVVQSFRLAVLAVGCMAMGGAGQAEPLRDVTMPLCSSIDADFRSAPQSISPNCVATAVGGERRQLHLKLKAARGVAKIGKFEITDAYLYNGAFAPEVWSLDPGDALLVDFENGLTGDAGLRTNLHTHGLIVSPVNAPGTENAPLSDNVYVAITGEGSDPHAGHAGGAPAAGLIPVRTFEKRASYKIEIPPDHPQGLFWYHPHPHGISEPQVLGGMSGLITIGRAEDYVTLEEADGRIEEKLLMLKDMQVTREAGASNWQVNDDYDADNCDEKATKEPGICRQDADNAWLFTVNGQIHPTIEIAQEGGQLWRIGNIGADVTYNLELVMAGANGKEEKLPFQVISIDGVSVGRDPSDEPIIRDQVLMMPSSRVELLVTHPGKKASGAKAVFRTAGFGTGATPDDGDHWPQIDLADVVFETSLSDPDEDEGAALVEDGKGAVPLPTDTALASDPSCRRLASGETRIVAFDIPSFDDNQKPGVDFAVPQGCMADQEYDIIGNTIANFPQGVDFETILDIYDKAVGEKYASPLNGKPQAYRGKCFDGVLDTCVPYPSVEEWWVINASTEAHNFHIHQTRFQVLAVAGTNSDFTPFPDVYEDNFPVLAGQAIKVRIWFTRPEQVGTFVYHCHILEHEDNGMMAAIEVRDLSGSR